MSAPDAVTAGAGVDFVPEPFHRLLRGPAVQVIADDPLLLPQAPRHAGAEMAPEEVQSLPALPQVYYLRLARVQPQPQAAEDLLTAARAALACALLRHSTTPSSA